MDILRKILFPFAFLYGEIVALRNLAYNKGILKSTKFDLPVIVVGNLNVGGTGKSPQIEFLIHLLHQRYKVAVVSRGYHRKSKGYQLANAQSTAADIGDEPFQFYRKFEAIYVVADANRVHAINKLTKLNPKPDVILLDDAFQHRKVAGGLNILLTAYDDLYSNDYMLPTGYLREKRSGAARADIIVVTKCPDQLSETERVSTLQKIKPLAHQKVFFSKITYHNAVLGKNRSIALTDLKNYQVLLVTGIAKSKPLCQYLSKHKVEFQHLKFSDHHNFTSTEIHDIWKTFDKIEADKKIVLTTEKDYVRTFYHEDQEVFYLPIQTAFLAETNEFEQLILDYVQQDSRNG